MVSSQIICTNKPLWLGWMVVIFQALVGCHDILILGKSPIKWRQRPDMTLAVDWDVKHQLKQTNKQVLKYMYSGVIQVFQSTNNCESYIWIES